MPAVMYLTWYKDEPTRNAAWDKFRAPSGLATDQEPAGICLYSHPKHQSAPLTIALLADIRKLKIKKPTVMRQAIFLLCLWSCSLLTGHAQEADEANYDESKIPPYTLPALLKTSDGGK